MRLNFARLLLLTSLCVKRSKSPKAKWIYEVLLLWLLSLKRSDSPLGEMIYYDSFACRKDVNLVALTGRVLLLSEKEVTKKSLPKLTPR